MTTSSGTGKATTSKPEALLKSAGVAVRPVEVDKGVALFNQGDTADALYFLVAGRIRLTVTVAAGREATVAVLGPGDVLGERSLVPDGVRAHSACVLTRSTVLRVDADTALAAIGKDSELARYVLERIVSRMNSYERALVHHITNNSEHRLARALLELAHYDGSPRRLKPIEGVSQSVLAEMIGTTRPRTNAFMNKFRRLGFIDYLGTSIVVNPKLVTVLLRDNLTRTDKP
ncbi:MAG TPA: Crp/Fnr family transcriptional regulator [Terriglobales bacterium]